MKLAVYTVSLPEFDLAESVAVLKEMGYEGIRINYRVAPGLIVWLLMLLPVALLAALLVMQVEVAFVGGFGLLIGFIYFAYTFQRGKAIARFEKRFGK